MKQIATAIGPALVIFSGVCNAAVAADTLPKNLIGTWSLVALTSEQDGKSTEPYGPNPKGIQILGGDGRFVIVITNPHLPKFASGKRIEGTAEENKAVVQGSIAYFGTYTASEADKTWTVSIEGSIFPNWIGLSQVRHYSINGDELIITNEKASSGSPVRVVWRRVQ
jgi:hypothetical protein